MHEVGNKALSVNLWPYDPITLGAVTLYENNKCNGQQGLFYASSKLYEKIGYLSNDLTRLGFGLGSPN